MKVIQSTEEGMHMLNRDEIKEYCEDEPNSYGAGMLLSFIIGAIIAIVMVWGISMLKV
ncbi:hypothetical protein HMPREF0083_01848 [Aneurinibacillus aneurinilyticus ATCC 12856]|jgi:VIT1/CCC1 family predicted Fe2+/Mn2+ transporter|uniref:Uncharacterized protein n=2 Tax=Aneurinibacillus aneurinilyticus TaxID=1391 RepID=U1YDB3_ANEAE|nr:hypothetical protein HMPREF0083_01848 [Aneurinibacillus aneurinilyticus ATCC 12856]